MAVVLVSGELAGDARDDAGTEQRKRTRGAPEENSSSLDREETRASGERRRTSFPWIVHMRQNAPARQGEGIEGETGWW